MTKRLLVFGFFIFLSLSLFAQVSTETMKEIQLLLNEKASRTPAQLKIDSRLLQAVRENRGQKMAPGVDLEPANVDADITGHLKVDIDGNITDALLSKLTLLGAKIVFPSALFHTVRAIIHLQDVEKIASFPEVKFIQPAVKSMVVDENNNKLFGRQNKDQRIANFRTQLENLLKTESPLIGKITSQGDADHRAADVRTTFGYLGAGIKIGVLSDSYNATGGASADVTSGDLPGTGNPDGYTTPVTVVQDYSGGDDEGRAMLQVIHDLAPAAQLYFATADVSEAGFASNILSLRNNYGCNIICDDVAYFDEPAFQDGTVAQAVNTVTAAGALYFSSAGNSGALAKGTSGVFEGDFNDAGSAAFSGSSKGGTIHNFGTTSSPVNGDIVKTLGEGVYNLIWSDPWGASTNDYDLFLVSSAGKVKSSSTTSQTGSQNPYEAISASSLSSGDRLVVFKTTAAAVRAFHLNTNRGTLTVATNGQTTGHACAVAAFCMAATPAAAAFESGYPSGPYPNAFNSSNVVEPFSSDGPRKMFYNANGTAITAGSVTFASGGGTTLSKPDLTAADGVSTTFGSSTGLNPFFGTSCAAPHAGAIAALIWSANPSMTAAQIRTILTSTALDIEGSGYDVNSGYGIIQAYQAAQQVTTSCGVPSGLSVSAITSISATTAWTAVGGANSYDVAYGTSQASLTTVTGITTNSYGLSSLAASTKYYFKVATVCASGTSAYSTVDSFTTSASATCGVPTGLTVSSINASSATTGWTAVSGANSYNVAYGTSLSSLTTVTGITTNSYALSSLASSTKYYFEVATVCTSGTSDYSTVDSFTTAASATCGVPAGLTASSITTSSATTGWAAVSGANSYNVAYGTSKASLTTVTGITTNSYALSSLASSTKYYFEVATVCTSGTSAYSAVDSFTTSGATVSYCTSSGSTTYEYIKTVVLGSINHISTNDGGYSNLTAYSTALTAGSTYTITLTPGFTSTKYAEDWTVYIDYNQDGTLNGKGETALKIASTKSGSASGSFKVPATAKNGTTRLRIQMHYGSYSTNPCGVLDYGDVQDYSVNISGGSGSVITENLITQADNKASLNLLSIVPNPVSGSASAKAFYKLSNAGNAILKVVSLDGKTVAVQNLGLQTPGEHNFTLTNITSKLHAGYYIIVIEQNNEVIARNRFIVAK